MAPTNTGCKGRRDIGLLSATTAYYCYLLRGLGLCSRHRLDAPIDRPPRAERCVAVSFLPDYMYYSTVWLVSKCTDGVKNQENIGMRHINVLPRTSRTRIHAVWLLTFSRSGVNEVAILEVHLRDHMTLSRESIRGLVPKTRYDSFDPKILVLKIPFAPYGLMGGLILREVTEKNWNAKLLACTEDPCPHAPRKKLQKIPKTE